MKTLTNKIRFILILAFISLASFIISLFPLFVASAAYYPATVGFGVTNIGVNLNQNNASDYGNTKFTITFTVELTEDCFNNFTENGTKEIAVGMLVGPNQFVTNGDVTNYQTALDNKFHAIMNYGTENSGANNLIEFDYNGTFTFEGGVNFNEKLISAYKMLGKSADDLLYDAASLDLAVIPFYAVCENELSRTPVVNMGDAVSFMAKPHLHEAYIASKYNNPDAPAVSDYMLQKFVTKNNNIVYQESAGEYYIDKGLDTCFYAKNVGEDLNYYNAVVLMSKTSKDRLYIAGYEFTGESTGINDDRQINPIPFVDNLVDRENYTYSITLFKSNGNIVTVKAKCVTSVISSPGSYLETDPSFSTGITYSYKKEDGSNQYFTSRFVNPADENGYATKIYNGYYVLGKNIRLLNSLGHIGEKPTKSDGIHGFTGVFDGRGKVLYDGTRRYQNLETGAWLGGESVMATNGAGIFGVLEGATIKNFAIYNATMGIFSEDQTIIASVINNSTIENVYLRPLSFYNYKESSFSQKVGYLFANTIENSTMKNVVIENSFLDINVASGDAGYNTRNSSAVATFNNIKNSTLENVFVAGCSPLSATILHGSAYEGFGLEIGVTELPKLANGATAKEGDSYYFSASNNSTLVEEFKPLVEFIGLNCYSLKSLEQESLFVRFKLMPSEIKTFSTLRSMALTISGDAKLKKDFLDTPYWRIDGNELLWNVIANDVNYGNVYLDITSPADLTTIKEEDGHTLTGIVPYM